MRTTAPTGSVAAEGHTRRCNWVWIFLFFLFVSFCHILFVWFFFGRGDAVRIRSIDSDGSVASWGGMDTGVWIRKLIWEGWREIDDGLAMAEGVGHLRGISLRAVLWSLAFLHSPEFGGRVGSIQSTWCRFNIVLEYPCGL